MSKFAIFWLNVQYESSRAQTEYLMVYFNILISLLNTFLQPFYMRVFQTDKSFLVKPVFFSEIKNQAPYEFHTSNTRNFLLNLPIIHT